jgi:hypothetical protein
MSPKKKKLLLFTCSKMNFDFSLQVGDVEDGFVLSVAH